MKPVVPPPLPGYRPEPGYRPPTHPLDKALRRAIVDALEFSSDCPRPACRRAGRCRDRNTTCFDLRRAEIIAGIETLLYDGYVVDDADDPF